MEKAVITPDQYPLSLNALVNACNQKSSREPVMNLDPGVVQRAVNDLVAKRLIMVQNFGSRVDKYQQRLCNTQFAQIQLTPAEYAIVCLLFLRGPQAPGELKAHSGRLHEFKDLGEVDAALATLLERPAGPLVARLPREPRRKDHAYGHLFSGPIESVPREAAETRSEAAPASRSAAPSSLAALEARVAALERELASLKEALGIATQ
jgi:uncharacterized protein YceH (UPF0502 family)